MTTHRRFLFCLLAFSLATNPAIAQGSGAAASPSLTIQLGNDATMELKLLPAGRFVMGSPEADPMTLPSEIPQHELLSAGRSTSAPPE